MRNLAMSCPVAFVDVDTQVDFMDPKGNLYVPGAEVLVENLRALVNLALKRRIPLLSSVDTHVPDDPEFKVFPPHCVRGTPGHAKIRETTVSDSRWVGMRPENVSLKPGQALLIEKHIYSLFDNPNTPGILAQLDAGEYVVFGVATDYCVRAAALGLREHGLKTTVITDAIKPVTEEGGRKAREEMRNAGVRFATTQEVLAAWDRDAR